MERRKVYAQRIREVEIKNEKTKQEILNKIQGTTHDVIGALGEVECHRKNKNALSNEYFARQ